MYEPNFESTEIHCKEFQLPQNFKTNKRVKPSGVGYCTQAVENTERLSKQ